MEGNSQLFDLDIFMQTLNPKTRISGKAANAISTTVNVIIEELIKSAQKEKENQNSDILKSEHVRIQLLKIKEFQGFLKQNSAFDMTDYYVSKNGQ